MSAKPDRVSNCFYELLECLKLDAGLNLSFSQYLVGGIPISKYIFFFFLS